MIARLRRSLAYAWVAVGGVLLLGCAPSQLPAAASNAVDCHPTVAHMTPPSEAIEFFAQGSTAPDRAREMLNTANWYGNEAMWVVLPDDGELVGRLDDKIPPYRLKRGRVQYEAIQLDGPGVVARRAIGPDAYGDIRFAAGGPAFPTVGCWEVTYTLEGQDALRFVLRVR